MISQEAMDYLSGTKPYDLDTHLQIEEAASQAKLEHQQLVELENAGYDAAREQEQVEASRGVLF